MANKMIDIRITTKDNIDELMSSRLEMLKVVNNLPEDYEYPDEMINEICDYFLNGDHLTVLAMDKDVVIGCASMSFVRIMPTFEHPTGKRAHLMNVYTRSEYRRQGIAEMLLDRLISEARETGYSYMVLDTMPSLKEAIRLYEKKGFYRIGKYNNNPFEKMLQGLYEVLSGVSGVDLKNLEK